MATVYKIHPAIGIARVGNSPNEFFIGPERVGERPDPPGGFKDAQCRVKRQAARFRIFAHHDDNTVEEITDAEAEITWTVNLVNKKAANPGRNNTESAADLTIDPGTRTLNGPNQSKEFDNGEIKFSGASAVKVPLGQIRSDDDNHLLVLGGLGKAASPLGTGIGSFWGNDDWYDDVSDGPVSATIKIRATNATPSVVAAWVIVTPPKFAAHIDNVITLYDRVFQTMVEAGLANAPNATSYTNDVYPILQRARDTKWLENVGGAHGWADPVTGNALRNAIFNRLSTPGGGGADMPDLNESTNDGRLTVPQYGHMQRWKDDNYANDWAGVPTPEANITPAGLDRSALENCVGGAFFPGIEAGGLNAASRPIVTAGNYMEAFRLDPSAVSAGDISYTMALPWQADFYACGDNWWPVPRPNDVIPQGQNSHLKWDRDVNSYEDMVAKWHTLGFIVRQGNEHVEVERCDAPSITLLTPHLNFQDIPQGPMGMVREQPLAISFEVISQGGAVTLEYAQGGAPSHVQLVAFNTSDTVGPTASNQIVTARLWVIFRTAAVGAIPQQTLTVRHAASGQEWTVTVDANAVARKTAATALVLDRSGSMSEDRGDGQSKHSSMQEAASIFVDVMLEGDAVGLVCYNENAQVLQPAALLGGAGLSDIARVNTLNSISGNGLDPQGSTSIGDGIFEGRAVLNAQALVDHDVKALVVLTDGKENRSRYIADVAAEIDERTYAIGFGTPQNTSAPALQTISGNTGGYLLITGAINQNNRFLLQKYFLQVLAGVSNAEVVLDPDGQLVQGAVHRIPFQLTDADAGVDVILLTPNTKIVDFRLQTPTGQIIEPWRAASEPGMRYVVSQGVTYYRLVLPTQLVANRFDQGGTWHALLRIGHPRFKETSESEDGVDREYFAAYPANVDNDENLSRRRRLIAERSFLLATHDTVAAPPTTAAAASQPSLPYSLVVHSYSSLSLRAHVEQYGFEPGDMVELSARLTEAGIPMSKDAAVWAEIGLPDGSSAELVLAELRADGRYSATFDTSIPGVYRFRLRARGRTRNGQPFVREQALTAAVWRGGSRDADGTNQGGNGLVDVLRERDAQFCELLRCITAEGGVIGPDLEKRLRESGLDFTHLRKCLELFCRSKADRKSGSDG